MNAKEKAKRIINKFSSAYGVHSHPATVDIAQDCARIHVNEMLKDYKSSYSGRSVVGRFIKSKIEFLEKVKTEIEAL